MAFIRKNIYDLGGDWDETILWYARGVAAMKSRALNDPLSWRFFGAIHGFNAGLWQFLGYLNAGEAAPSQTDQRKFWNQCQHGSWYFLPWHRGYLLALEACVRAEIIRMGGPNDWALPYWNYFKTGQSSLPPAFATPNWPDGHGNNPLFVPQRYGPQSDGHVFVPLNRVNLNALGDIDFTGSDNGSGPGFGGVDTGFSHGGGTHGDLESQPHDMVHVYVGGGNNATGPGLMSDPRSAGLDPIFYLHHANIDRLWQTWRLSDSLHVDPTDPQWLNGPASIGQKPFVMPMPNGTSWIYTPAQMSDFANVGYVYDDYSSDGTVPSPTERFTTLGANLGDEALEIAMKPGQNVELVGASQEALQLAGTEVKTSVKLDTAAKQRITNSLDVAAESFTPDRIFLNLENVRGKFDATTFGVYIDVPNADSPDGRERVLAGHVGLFGVSSASDPNEEHGGQGLNFVLDITNIVDRLHLEGSFDVDKLNVSIVPDNEIPEESATSIGRISIYRQGK